MASGLFEEVLVNYRELLFAPVLWTVIGMVVLGCRLCRRVMGPSGYGALYLGAGLLAASSVTGRRYFVKVKTQDNSTTQHNT
jgi:hypothetical protein